jgi:hypothetical protein
MSFTLRRTLNTVTAVFGAMLAAGTALTVGGAATPAASAAISRGSAPAAKPPWEPDPNSVGGLVFYNSAGHVITGGSTNDSPVAAYVKGTKTIGAGDTKAALFGFLPVHGQPPGQWSGEQLGSSTPFPNLAAPKPLNTATLPVETGKSGDETIAELEADFPNTDTSNDGYADMYVLRLKTSAEGQPGNTTYDSADIQVDNSTHTWTVVYTRTLQVATTTTLAVSPRSSAYHGATVKLTAKVTPNSSAGSIQFLDGAKVLKDLAVKSGGASYSTDRLADGTHKLSARFLPTDISETIGSVSSVHDLKVRAHPTATSLKASGSTITKGHKLTLTAHESPAVAGSVSFFDGKKKVASVKVSRGEARYSSTRFTVGIHSFKASFTPSVKANDAASSSKIVKVSVKK